MELILFKAFQAGGAVAAAAVLFAIYKLLEKRNKSENAEGLVYELLAKEVARLSRALEESDIQMKALRKECNEERIQFDYELAEMRNTIRELRDKLIGD